MKVLSKEEIQKMAQQIYSEKQQSEYLYAGRLQQLEVMLQYLEQPETVKEEVPAAQPKKVQPVQEIVEEQPADKPEAEEPAADKPEEDKVYNHIDEEFQPRKQAEESIAKAEAKAEAKKVKKLKEVKAEAKEEENKEEETDDF